MKEKPVHIYILTHLMGEWHDFSLGYERLFILFPPSTDQSNISNSRTGIEFPWLKHKQRNNIIFLWH